MSSSDSQTAFGKESELYQDFAIPRAKLKDSANSSAVVGRGSQENVIESREQRNLEGYLETRGRAPSVERLPVNAVVTSDVIHRLPAGPSVAREESEYYSSGSELSSAASWQDQYERRVTTDYKKTETTKTTAAANTTAEFHVFPPNKSEAITMGGASKSGQKSYKTTTTTSTRYEVVLFFTICSCSCSAVVVVVETC